MCILPYYGESLEIFETPSHRCTAHRTERGVLCDQQLYSAISSNEAHLVWTVVSMDHGKVGHTDR